MNPDSVFEVSRRFVDSVDWVVWLLIGWVIFMWGIVWLWKQWGDVTHIQEEAHSRGLAKMFGEKK